MAASRVAGPLDGQRRHSDSEREPDGRLLLKNVKSSQYERHDRRESGGKDPVSSTRSVVFR
jgi:hypothetical protein